MAATIGVAKFGRSARDTVLYLSKHISPYRNVVRAWWILGYRNAKPSEAEFRDHVNQLWRDLTPGAEGMDTNAWTKRTQKVRRYILWAIDAIAWYRNPRFTAAAVCQDLNLTNLDIPVDRPRQHWQQLPYPLNANRYRAYCRSPATRAHVLRDDAYNRDPGQPSPAELVDVGSIYKNQWQRYHRYYGFYSWDGQGKKVEFKAMPVPRNQWSLWHAVS